MSKLLDGWRDIGGPAVGNGSAYFATGAKYIDKALSSAQDAVTDHQNEKDKAFWLNQENMAAKLLDIKKDRPLTEEDYKLAGIVNRMPMNKESRKRDVKDRDYNLDLRKTNADIANINSQMKTRVGKEDPMTTALRNHALKLDFLQAEKDAGKYKTKSSGKSGIYKVLDEANLLFDPLDSGKSTVDGDNDTANKSFVATATAKGVPRNVLRDAIMKNTKAGGWMSYVSGLDEQGLDIEGAAQMLIKAGYIL